MASHSPSTTAVLLQAAKDGSRSAADRLFARFMDPVTQIVSLRLGKRRADLLPDVEDIVQETLMDALRSLRGFHDRGDKAFLHWLVRLAEHNVLDALKRQRALKRGEGRRRSITAISSSFLLKSGLAGKPPTPGSLAQRQELAERLESALLGLSERDRNVILLSRVCGRPFKDIAEELGLGSESNARSTCSRALAKLSKALGLDLSKKGETDERTR